jgi:hypothetical protein
LYSRRFTVKYLGGRFTKPFTLDFDCRKVNKPSERSLTAAEAAANGCSATNPIVWQGNASNTGSYDLLDDKTIIVRFIDDFNSGCPTLANRPIVLTLTKS